MDNPLTHNPFTGLPKWGKIAVIAGGGSIGAYALYSHHKKTGSWNIFTAASPSGAASGSTTDPTTGLDASMNNQTDPLTSMTYLAEAQQYGSVAAAEQAVSEFGGTNMSNSQGTGSLYAGYTAQTATSDFTTTTGTNVYTSNSSWAQAATAGLTDVGYDGPTVSAALGAYLTGTPLSPAQVTLVNTAIGEYGPPPSGNLQVIAQPASQPAPAPKPAAGPSAVDKYPAPSGLRAVSSGNRTDTVTWNLIKSPTPAPLSYTVAAYGKAGNTVHYGTVTVPDTANSTGQTTITFPEKGTYKVEVWANGGKEAPPHATTTATSK